MSLLEIENLGVEFRTDEGIVRAVDGISLAIEPGETLGIVGESGSGKSVSSLAILGLVPQPPGKITSGQAIFEGQNLLAMPQRKLASIRGNRIAMIFQDPMTSLNPFLTIAQQLTEVTQLHLRHTHEQALKHAISMLERVGIPAPARRIHDYPHQFSGGMRQRVMIAMALACKPALLIADEPTTALDVTIQAQILELMKELQRAEGTAIILITHDLGVVANICRRVNVMYAGRFVEEAPVDDLFARPRHPYTLGLLQSIPRLDATQEALTPIRGQPPDLIHLPTGCAFHPRCPNIIDRCPKEVPPLFPGERDVRYACFNPARQ
ncbi:MAG TPA: ABC transporter ATP-binding protein [Pirellulales bacterium]|jgi:oligopeptide transport system ATP-binding protein|nr:ABC transporter ATP-binding protein [Pirellulales bacterium]